MQYPRESRGQKSVKRDINEKTKMISLVNSPYENMQKDLGLIR